MNYLTFLEELRTRREMEQTKIDYALLDEVIRHARLASSARNAQPIRYVYITEPELVKEIFECTNLITTHNIPLQNAPSAFILMGIVDDYPSELMLGMDLGIAAQIIREQLALNDYTSMCINSFDRNKAKKVVDIENFQPQHLLAIGKSKQRVYVKDGDSEPKYYRDENDVHTIVKLNLNELVLAKK